MTRRWNELRIRNSSLKIQGDVGNQDEGSPLGIVVMADTCYYQMMFKLRV